MWSRIFDLSNWILKQSHADFKIVEVSCLTYILKSSDIVVERKKKQIIALHHTSLPPFSLALDSPGKVNFKLFFLLVQFFCSTLPTIRGEDKPAAEVSETYPKAPKYWGQTILGSNILGLYTEHIFHSPRFYSARDAFVLERM